MIPDEPAVATSLQPGGAGWECPMRVIYVSCRAGDARDLAERLVAERWVACASIVPRVESVYRWEGRVEREEEAMLWMETADDRADAAVARIAELHDYDVPKIVTFEAARSTPAYAEWVETETRPDD